MLRTFLVLGLVIIAGSMLAGVLFGMLGAVLGLLFRALLVGLVAYILIRLISPRTAAKIRHAIEGRTLPPE